MQVISAHEAASDLARLLASVEAGEEFVIARGGTFIAKLAPFTGGTDGRRPKAGEMVSPPFEVPAEALAPLSSEDLKQWGI
jgi:antitoxin (DNA-binding transcriptional repressor) of toxin-antitoxin stability system